MLPTICDYAEVNVPDYLLGRSIRQVAEGGLDNPRRPFIVAENNTGRMIRSERYKYCVYTEGMNRESLVDLKKDPGEMRNLASKPEYHEILNQHRTYLHQWIEESNDKEAQLFAISPD